MSAHGCSFAQDRSNFGYATAKAEQPAQDSFIFGGLQDSKLDRWTALTYQSRDLLFLQVSWSELQTAVGFCFFSLNDRMEKEEPDEEKEVEENMTKRHSGREETRKAKRTSKTLQWVQQNEECLAMSKADARESKLQVDSLPAIAFATCSSEPFQRKAFHRGLHAYERKNEDGPLWPGVTPATLWRSNGCCRWWAENNSESAEYHSESAALARKCQRHGVRNGSHQPFGWAVVASLANLAGAVVEMK